MSNILVMPLGGLEQVGANCTLIGYQDKWIMIDLGIAFNDNKLGIDIITPDVSFPISLKDKLKAIFITHAHEDHIGGLCYFWSKFNCPIYLTDFSASVLKMKLSDRKLDKDSTRVVQVPTRSPILIDDFKVEFVQLAHSVLGACGIYIQTPGGNVFHTGDWKIDNTPLLGDQVDKERLQQIGKDGIDCLLCDSTNVLVKDEVGSEQDVKITLDQLISKYKNKRIIITCFASNIARIAAILELAKKYNRKVVIIGRSIFKMLNAVSSTAYYSKELKINIENIIDESCAAGFQPEQVLMLCTGSQGEKRSAIFRLARGENKQLKLGSNDVILFSSKVIPGNELCIRNMQNLLAQRGVEVVTSESEKLIHVSGHPNKNALLQMYQWLSPKSLIPIHGDPVMLYAHKQFADDCQISNSMVLTSGDVVSVQKNTGKLRKLHHTEVVYNTIDGKYIIPIYSNCIRERATLSTEGHVSVGFIIQKGNKLGKTINLAMHGIYITENIFNKIKSNIANILASVLMKSTDEREIKNEAKANIKSLIYQMCLKKPIIDVLIQKL